MIRRWISPQWRFTHIASGEYRDPATAARLKRLGGMPGWPDLMFAGPDRQMAFLELKRRGSGRLSDEQAAMRDHLVGCGFAYLCTTAFLRSIGSRATAFCAAELRCSDQLA